MSRTGGAVAVQLRIEYDDDERRYTCTEFIARRSPLLSGGKGFVTSETLRQPPLSLWIQAALRAAIQIDGTIRELPNPDKVEPWGLTVPPGLTEEGPTDRVLQWVAHLYHYGLAISFTPAKVVEDQLELPHGTAARWIRLAREKGYLGPSEGPGKAAG